MRASRRPVPRRSSETVERASSSSLWLTVTEPSCGSRVHAGVARAVTAQAQHGGDDDSGSNRWHFLWPRALSMQPQARLYDYGLLFELTKDANEKAATQKLWRALAAITLNSCR